MINRTWSCAHSTADAASGPSTRLIALSFAPMQATVLGRPSRQRSTPCAQGCRCRTVTIN
jgi:hypothetical protein